MRPKLTARVGSGIVVRCDEAESVLGKAGVRSLRAAFEHNNPDFYKAQRSGRQTWGIPRKLATWREDEGGAALRFPRGGANRIRAAARDAGAAVRFVDERVFGPEVDFPPHRFGDGAELRWYQLEAIDAIAEKHQGVVRAPTGSGKTSTGLALISTLRRRTLVIVRKASLVDQWLRRIESELGIPRAEVGVLGGGKRRVGERITVGLQQTLWSEKFPLADVGRAFGLVLIDECQDVAARSFQVVADAIPAAYRVGLSADERRNDRKEFLIHDVMGDVIHETHREDLEREGSVVPVVVRIVESPSLVTDYVDAGPERDFGAALEALVGDEARDDLVVAAVRDALRLGQRPVLVFTRRREHAQRLADRKFFAAGIRSGLLLGTEGDRVRFEEDLARLAAGDLDACVGTIEAVGVGTDVPALRAGVLALPLGDNPQLFNQIRGRICRVAEGKRFGFLYYVLDRPTFPSMAPRLYAWAGGRIEAWDGSAWVPATRDGIPIEG